MLQLFSYLPQVWDGLTGTQLQSLTTHEADVLCLCVSEAQTEIFASGCDGKVCMHVIISDACMFWTLNSL